MPVYASCFVPSERVMVVNFDAVRPAAYVGAPVIVTGGQMVAHAPVHELVPGVLSPDEVYNVMPWSLTRTTPSLVVAVATVAFAPAPPFDVDTDPACVAAAFAAGVVVEAALELLEHALSATAVSVASATNRQRLDPCMDTPSEAASHYP